MGFDVKSMVEKALESGMTVWVEFTDGFEIEVKFVGREAFQSLYNKCTRFQFNPKTHKREDVPDRDKFYRLWGEKTIKDWRGLTLGKLAKLVPIKPGKEEDLKQDIPCEPENKQTLLKHNGEFDDLILAVASNYEVFQDNVKEMEGELKNLKQ